MFSRIPTSKGNIKAVRDHFPRVIHVFDQFLVLKLSNEKRSVLRRELYREESDDHQRKLLKGRLWLLLKDPENLDDDRNEMDRLAEALHLNTPLTKAYYLKEELRQTWKQALKAAARRLLDS